MYNYKLESCIKYMMQELLKLYYMKSVQLWIRKLYKTCDAETVKADLQYMKSIITTSSKSCIIYAAETVKAVLQYKKCCTS